MLTKYNGAGGYVVIPEGVTRIGESAFKNCSSLSSITIPESVTRIGESAFENCSSLSSITIPNSVTSICENAFNGCGGLTSITVGQGNMFYNSRNNCNAIIETGTNKLIRGCKNTVIPDSVTSIGDSAFNGCGSLTSITVDQGNMFYDSRDNCNAIIKTMTNELIMGCKNTIIPDSVTIIGNSAFDGCSSLSSITIPDSVIWIGWNAFNGCSGLTSITVGQGNMFYDSRNNCNAIIKTGTNELMMGCKNTIIPNSVTGIGESAFSGCSSLTSIIVPDSVMFIDVNAFDGCSALTTIKGRKGSYAEIYAKNNGYKFVDIDNDTSDGGGDADCNGTVNLEDATIVLRIAVGIKPKNPVSEQGQKNADFDKSGKVDLKDATYTLKTAVGIKFTLPKI